MPRSYASDLLVDDIDLDAERIAGRPYRSGRRRSDLFMVVLAAGVSAAILFNALMMQGPRREGAAVPLPASPPSAMRQISAPSPNAAAPAASAPAAPPALSQEAATPPVPADTVAAAPRPPVKPPVPPKPAAIPAAAPVATAPAGMVPPANVIPAVPATSVTPPAPVAASARVMEVQKALARLGYGPIRIDGRVSDSTRDAIQRFERDRRMTITGEVSDRLVRALNEVAGFSIQ